MAQQPLQPCRECQKLCSGRYCSDHQHITRDDERAYDLNRRRNDPFRKLYNCVRWYSVRALVLARDIMCQSGKLCMNPDTGVAAFSTEVDHIVPARVWVAQHGGDMNSFYDESNLQGLCARCHKSKTRAERAVAPEPAVDDTTSS